MVGLYKFHFKSTERYDIACCHNPPVNHLKYPVLLKLAVYKGKCEPRSVHGHIKFL